MKITCHHIENDLVKPLEDELSPEEWLTKTSWVNIITDDRTEVVDFFKHHSVFTPCNNYIKHPEQFSLDQTIGDFTILRLIMSLKDNVYKPDYVIIIISHETIITIIPESVHVFKKLMLSKTPVHKFSDLISQLYQSLASDLLMLSNINMEVARTRVNHAEKLLSEASSKVVSAEIMTLEREISQLSDIVEDQFISFGILETLSSFKSKEDVFEGREEMSKGFNPLNKSMTRLEKKARTLRLQFMLLQQEMSTRKINFLTVVQAVFVPLTFFAGVYGMNFLNMPELAWRYGYLFYWLFASVLAVGLLSYFYKHGWFD